MTTRPPPEADRRVRGTEERVHALLLAGRIATWQWDTAADRITGSQGLEVLFGLKPGQTMSTGRQGFELVHGEDREAHRALVEAAVLSRGSWHDEFRIVRPVDGKVAWLEERGQTLRDPRTGEYGVFGVAWDITERKQAEEALRESESRQRFLLELGDRLRPLSDPYQVMRGACEALARQLGGAAVQYCLVDVDQERAQIAAEYSTRSLPSATVGSRLRLSEQPSGWVDELRSGRDAVSGDMAAVPLLKDGRLVAWMSVSRHRAGDWSESEGQLHREVAERTWAAVERAHAEQAVRRSEEKYRALFTSIDEGFCIQEVIFDDTDRPIDLRYLEVNRAFERLTGRRDVVGRTAQQMMLDVNASWLRVQGQVSLSGEPVRFENYVAAWDKWFDVYSFRLGTAAERKVASVFTDITHRRRTEERLRRAAQLDGFRVALNDALRPVDDPYAIQDIAARVLGEALNANRVVYIEVESEAGADYFNVKPRYDTADVPARQRRYRVAGVGGTLVDELRAGRTVVVPDVENERRFTRAERVAYVSQDVRAFVEVPLVNAGSLAAVLTVQQAGRRDWTADEIARIEETAQRTWAAVDRARAAAALRRAREELEARVEERTRELEQTNASLRAEMAERRRAEQARHELLRQLVNAQEGERRRIARELHDDLGQLVSALVLKLSMLKHEADVPAGVRSQLDALESIARETDNVLDFAVWQLRPTALDDLGLVAALGDYVHNWSRHFGIDARFVAPAGEAMRMDPEIETVLYRIAQEALNNVAKYARAKHVEVRIGRGATHVSLLVADDGVGFVAAKAARGAKRLGIAGMRERAGFIGGETRVVSAPGQGTRIEVDIPLPSPS